MVTDITVLNSAPVVVYCNGFDNTTDALFTRYLESNMIFSEVCSWLLGMLMKYKYVD